MEQLLLPNSGERVIVNGDDCEGNRRVKGVGSSIERYEMMTTRIMSPDYEQAISIMHFDVYIETLPSSTPLSL
jgi:hypothetical protein